MSPRYTTIVATICTTLSLLLCATSASATLTRLYTGVSFGPDGTANTSFQDPEDLSIDQENGDIYVIDTGTQKLERFDSSHTPKNFTTGPDAGTNAIPGTFASPSSDQVAIDSSAGPAKGDIYVTEEIGSSQVNIYGSGGELLSTTSIVPETTICGVATDPAGNLYVGQSGTFAIPEYTPTANPVTASDRVAVLQNRGHTFSGCYIAADSLGNVYSEARVDGDGPVVRLNDEGIQQETIGGITDAHAIAVDPTDNDLLIDEGNEVVEFDSSGNRVGSFGTNGESRGIAVDGDPSSPSFGDVYVSNATTGKIDVFGPLIPAPEVSTEPATDLTATSATLNGTVDPGGAPVAECRFEYGTSTSYGQSLPCLRDDNGSTDLGSGDSAVPVHAEISGLPLLTPIHFRLLASSDGVNFANGGDQHFHGFGFLPGTAGLDSSIENEDGSPATQAGSHPYAASVSLAFNTTENIYDRQVPDEDVKDVHTALPPGLVGNPTVTPKCTLAQLTTRVVPPEGFGDSAYFLSGTACPDDSQVGWALTTITTGRGGFASNVYNMVPPRGVAAEFAFSVAGVDVFLSASTRSSGEFGLDIDVNNISQAETFYASKVTLWGVPADASHDDQRGPCLTTNGEPDQLHTCPTSSTVVPQAFITLPTSCTGPLTTVASIDSWQNPGGFITRSVVSHNGDGEPVGLDGCNELAFTPSISAVPSADSVSSPSGLAFGLDVSDPGLTSPEGLAQSDIKEVTVRLPEGMTANPSVAAGLAACSESEYESETVDSVPGAGCPNESKIGEVEVQTPLLSEVLHGSLFLAKENENPFHSLLALYVVIKNPETGILVKFAGKVEPNLSTGQLVSVFDDLPQVPFSHFALRFNAGQTAPLVTPSACGTYRTVAELVPWSAPETVRVDTSDFTVTAGVGGGPCPTGSVAPFDPQVTAGTINNDAGAYSPFYLRITRGDGEQEITKFSTVLPPGVTGNLTGIPFCSDAAIEAARSVSGTEENNNPSCSAASQIGHTLVGVGVGSVLAYAPGKIYLAGPYNGSALSVVSITSATVGPFDLGTVVIRFALRINPVTAQVEIDSTGSDPIPHIVDGIVVHVRDIRAYIDRPDFTINPTSCEHMLFTATVTGSGADFTNPADGVPVTVNVPFQAAGCQALKFKPIFQVSATGQTSRVDGAGLTVKLAYPDAPAGSQANIRSVKVDLPKQLPSRLSTLQKACPDSVFDANPAACPAASRVGHATAVTPILPVPLTGPAYFVSHGGAKFPELIIVLQGYGVTIDLNGETFITKEGVTSSTFPTIPDQPVTSFELTLPQGPGSALAANGNLCTLTKTITVRKKILKTIKGHSTHILQKIKQTIPTNLAMPTAFTAQNGTVIHQSTPVTITGCLKQKTKKPVKTRKAHKANSAHDANRSLTPTHGKGAHNKP
jgi:hypothetical protein